nr:hypothetical protein [Ruminococcus bromii]
MRKHSKFITILLSALLAVCLVQTVFVQAFATENSATPDEPTDGLRPVSMEVVKAPKTVNFLEGEELDSNFWSNVVLHIVYSDGREFDVNCDGIDSEDGILPPIAEIDSYTGDITVGYYREDGTANFTVEYCYGYEYYITAIFSVDVMQPVSMEVVKAPESVTVNNGRITDSTFWSNVVLHIVYSNGEEYDVNCDGADSEDGIVPPIAEICGYAGNITVRYYCIGDTVDFTVDYCYASSEDDRWERNTISAEYSVKEVADPHSITRVEVTKLPDKVFTAPFWTGEPDYSDSSWYEWVGSLDVNNSISHNCEGMEVTLYYANGEKCGTFAIADFKKNHIFNYLVNYTLENFDEYGNILDMQVYDLGDYKFSVSLGSSDTEMIYTAKSASNPNPSIKPVSTEDTPAKPEKPSGNISSATSDVATNDNANNNNSTNGTANNGVVATGNFATPAIITVVMLSAVAVMFVFKRKRMF